MKKGDDKDTVPYEWVIQHLKGEPAEYDKGLVDHGIGYFLRNETAGKGNSYEIEVAFRRVAVEPRPDSLISTTPQQAQALERLYAQRHRNNEQRLDRVSSNSVGGSEVGSVIRKMGLKTYYERMRAEKRTKNEGEMK